MLACARSLRLPPGSPHSSAAARPDFETYGQRPAGVRGQTGVVRLAVWDVLEELRQDHELRLEPLVAAAADLASDEGYVPATDYDWDRKGDVEAVVIAKNAPDALTPPDTPVAVVEFLPGAIGAPPMPDIEVKPDHIGYSLLRLSRSFPDSAISTIARWLRSNVGTGLTTEERIKLEVVIGEIQRLFGSGVFDREDKDEIAMVQTALDTLQAQLRAPRPSRNIIRWGLGQFPGFAIGSLAGVAGNYLTSLLGGL